jgi:ectoine hydroxylase-related dioxygenase (phytanoyl-CoA dioxygenase family)
MKSLLEKEGVFRSLRVLDPETLGRVIDEYQSAVPNHDQPVKHHPIVGFWTFVGEDKKKFKLLEEMPHLRALSQLVANVVRDLADGELRLLEAIVFNKPPQRAGLLHWHQDTSYFPLEPNNQIACWIPFDVVTENSGAMVYAIGSHKAEQRGSSNLLSGVPLEGEVRRALPKDPRTEGFEVRCFDMFPGDILIHDGRTWHASGPNHSTRERRGLSFRYIVGETRYVTRGGSAGPFTKQTDLKSGDLVNDPAFPIV